MCIRFIVGNAAIVEEVGQGILIFFIGGGGNLYAVGFVPAFLEPEATTLDCPGEDGGEYVREFGGEFFVLTADERGCKGDKFDTLPDGDALFGDGGEIVGGEPEFEVRLEGGAFMRRANGNSFATGDTFECAEIKELVG